MQEKTVKFNTEDRPEFFKVLRKRVNSHFKENKISKYANTNMKIKTIFMICLYFTPLAFILFGGVTDYLIMFGLWALMGFGMAGIGLSIMHDANHGSYSKNKNVNKTLGYLINFIGGFHVNWKIQHNVLHHSFTNIVGMDEDIETAAMRFSPDQEMKKAYKYQSFYAPFLYSLMTIYWFSSKDFNQLLNYNKRDLLKAQGFSFKSVMTQLIFNKVWYVGLTLVLPMILLGVPWWISLLGFVMMHLICGLILALIFQPAHVLEETDFFDAQETGSVENSWAIHQMATTANFANKSRVFSWLIGGLNFQIEHHLFPNICHVHYKNLSKIVKETAKEYGVPYYQHKTFAGAVKSHFSLLHQLGTGKYDEKMSKVA